MRCQQCSADLPGSAKFCNQCGLRVEVVCPACEVVLPPVSRFCLYCGKDLGKSTHSDHIDSSHPQNYTPKHLVEEILTSLATPEGEYKTVTILFADVASSTALFENLDPETVHEIMDGCFRILIEQVHRFEGTVNQFRGDCIMALFGAPVAQENHAQRACQAALAIQKALPPFRQELKRRYGINFNMRIGLNSGPVVVGAIGNQSRMDYTAQGDTANLAARMEALAEPGTIYATENTFRLAEGLLRFEYLGMHTVKGRVMDVGVYRPISSSSNRTRFDVNAERGLTPFVGRQGDLEVIFKAFQSSREGAGHAVAVTSNPGLGKSRLLYEFRKSITNEDVFFLEGKCLSFSRTVTYHPIIDILKSLFHIDENQTDAQIREKLATGLEALKIDSSRSLPYLLELLAVKDSGIDMVKTSPEARREWINAALISMVIAQSQRKPLIFIIEDLHWVDTASRGAISELLESIHAERVLLLLTYRPEFVPDWSTKSNFHQIVLGRLSEDNSLSMACHLLETQAVGSDIARQIIEKTEGVPFYIEEFVRSLKDFNIAWKHDEGAGCADEGALRIPSTIQDIIMARVDILPEAARHIIKTGSVIEREFSRALISRAAGLESESLAAGLAALKKAELIYQRGAGSDAAYYFNHALTMEVVYASLLSSQKQQIHGNVARAIEALHPEGLDEYSATLARHFSEAGFFEEAAVYAKAAAKRAMRSGAYLNAIAHSQSQVHALEQLPVSQVNQRRIIDARTVLANHFLSLDLYAKAKDAVVPIVDIAVELDYQKRLPGIYVALGSYYYWVDQSSALALEYLRKAVEVAENTGDFIYLWFSNFFLGTALSTECRFAEATECYNVSMALSEMGNHLRGLSAAKAAMTAYACLFTGRVDDAYNFSKDALQAAEECADAHTKGIAYGAHGAACFFKGNFDKAQRYLSDSIDFCLKANHLALMGWVELWLAHIHYYSQRYTMAILFFKRAVATWTNTSQLQQWLPYLKISLERAIISDGGHPATDFDPIRCRQKNKNKMAAGIIDATTADILINIDHTYIPKAESLVQSAIAADQHNDTKWCLGQDYSVYAEVCRAKGDQAGVKKNLCKEVDIFSECGADGWVDFYKTRLGSLPQN